MYVCQCMKINEITCYEEVVLEQLTVTHLAKKFFEKN